jgi:hypothetical protein
MWRKRERVSDATPAARFLYDKTRFNVSILAGREKDGVTYDGVHAEWFNARIHWYYHLLF